MFKVKIRPYPRYSRYTPGIAAASPEATGCFQPQSPKGEDRSGRGDRTLESRTFGGTSLEVQWLRLHPHSQCKRPGLIPSQGARSHKLQF